MIRTLIRILWLGLVRDRIALGLTFVLPIIFFTIFAMIFGNMGGGGGNGGGGMPDIRVIAVDLDDTEISARMIDALDAQDGVEIVRGRVAGESDDLRPYTRQEAIDLVYNSRNDIPAAVIIPAGFGESFGNFAQPGEPIEVIYEPTNPYAQQAIVGMIQGSSFQAAPDVLMESGLAQLDSLDEFDAGLTDEQREALEFIRPYLRNELPWSDLEDPDAEDDADVDAAAIGPMQGFVAVEATNVRTLVAREVQPGEGDDESDDIVPYFAAAIGVMFLLFSMVGAAGSMLKEAETGALDRVLSSNITMTGLLASKWAFFALIGAVQLFIMFIWGWAVFGIDLWTPNHLIGFWIMTIVTAAAASAFGMMLATLCKSRGQLDGISTIVILMMSAVGGSMVPKFVMPEFMQSLSDYTFNGQALNGYLHVFWDSKPGESMLSLLGGIAVPVVVLAAMAAAFFGLGRLFAQRWDAA